MLINNMCNWINGLDKKAIKITRKLLSLLKIIYLNCILLIGFVGSPGEPGPVGYPGEKGASIIVSLEFNAN